MQSDLEDPPDIHTGRVVTEIRGNVSDAQHGAPRGAGRHHGRRRGEAQKLLCRRDLKEKVAGVGL